VARSGAAPTRLKAANDNHGGRRSTIMIRMDGLPIMRGEVAVIDRLLQELPVAVNDNDVDPPERFIS
jgi:hypothetical protein